MSSGLAARASRCWRCFSVRGGSVSKVWLTGFLLIALPFPRRGAPGRDDADDLDSVALGVILGDGVGNQKHGDAMHHAKGLPAFFALLDPVLPGEPEGVAEHLYGHLKGNPIMLPLIGAVFGLVPGEAHCHDINVVAILPRLKALSDHLRPPDSHNPRLISRTPGSGVIKPVTENSAAKG